MLSLPPLEILTAQQQPCWPDPAQVEDVRATLRSLAPLITVAELNTLRSRLELVESGRSLVLQGGDCAELFQEAGVETVNRKLDLLRRLSDACRSGTGMPVVTIGRLAGQYAKPRSQAEERLPDGRSVPSYRGDAVNGAAADPAARQHDPRRLLIAYARARHVLKHVGATWREWPPEEHVFVSHELLLKDYELPLVRGWDETHYASSGHFGWIGDRTRALDEWHVSFAENICNPVGVKIGPTAAPADVARLVARLNPLAEPGRLTLIVRMGAAAVEYALSPIVAAVARQGIPVTWLCDPMHGNTVTTTRGQKTRLMPAMMQEVTSFVAVLRGAGQWAGGLHIEVTPDHVVECAWHPDDLSSPQAARYTSACDPRLNTDQADALVRHFLAVT
ncbi:3-deoxy-7-phosphoheptulonate synthase [Streptomyces sp. NBC_00289]|uniref:3-deoxy-7-phosphoheptulonate synthase n=1 Tax=Streptomyces sp. NBC_00289 TaxID=2975703 RepID=UPI0032567135